MMEKTITSRRLGMRRRNIRYHGKAASAIIQRWVDACSDKNSDCRNCPFLRDCQDLVDKLVA